MRVTRHQELGLCLFRITIAIVVPVSLLQVSFVREIIDQPGVYWVFWGRAGQGPTTAVQQNNKLLRAARISNILSNSLVAILAVLLWIISPRLAWWRCDSDGFRHCDKCGYILHGLTSARCPECGTAVEGRKGGKERGHH